MSKINLVTNSNDELCQPSRCTSKSYGQYQRRRKKAEGRVIISCNAWNFKDTRKQEQ